MNGTLWNDDTIEYFKKLNKPGCEGDYIRAITDFVHNNCYNGTLHKYAELSSKYGFEMDYNTLIDELITETKR